MILDYLEERQDKSESASNSCELATLVNYSRSGEEDIC